MLVWIKTIVSRFHGSVFKKTKRHGPPLCSSGLKQLFQGFLVVFCIGAKFLITSNSKILNAISSFKILQS